MNRDLCLVYNKLKINSTLVLSRIDSISGLKDRFLLGFIGVDPTYNKNYFFLII